MTEKEIAEIRKDIAESIAFQESRLDRCDRNDPLASSQITTREALISMLRSWDEEIECGKWEKETEESNVKRNN